MLKNERRMRAKLELEDYFLNGATQCLSSNHNALVAIANGELSGLSEHGNDSRLTCRVEVGAAATKVTLRRAYRTAYRAVPPRQQGVLLAAYGPIPFLDILDEPFGRGNGEKVLKRLGELTGPAFLTEAVRVGGAKAASDKATPRVWRSPAGWLVSRCLKAGDPDLEVVKRQAEASLDEAVRSYSTARAEAWGARDARREPSAPVAPEVRVLRAERQLRGALDCSPEFA